MLQKKLKTLHNNSMKLARAKFLSKYFIVFQTTTQMQQPVQIRKMQLPRSEFKILL